MSAVKIAIAVVYIIVSVALVILVLMQEGKTKGLGSISGAAETYWGKKTPSSLFSRRACPITFSGSL